MIFLFFTAKGKKVIYFPVWDEAAKEYIVSKFAMQTCVTRLVDEDILYWKKDGATYSTLVVEQLKACKRYTRPTELAVKVCFHP